MTEDAKIAACCRSAGPSTAGSWTRAIIRALYSRGVDGRALAVEVGIDPVCLDAPDGRVPVAANAALWRRATQATGDPCFGLDAARFVTAVTFQPLAAAVLASSTLREALSRIVRYRRVIADAAMVRLEDDGERVRFLLDGDADVRPVDEAIDAFLALTLRVVRLLRENRDVSPLRVELKRDEPAESEAFARVFRAPVVFRAARNALEFARRDLDAPLPNANAELSGWAEQVVNRSLAKFDAYQIVSRVRAALLARLPHGEPAQQAVARALQMSARTMQRRLTAAGTAYHTLLDETRIALARTYLTAGWSVTDIAFALGFSSPSSFSRAFRRWTGRSPTGAADA